MIAATLLENLEGVRATGPTKWIAKCPSHEAKSPSLAIRECAHGRALLHDFASCSSLAIAEAADMQLSDIFPARRGHHTPRQRSSFDPMEVLRCSAPEVQSAACLVADVINGKPISMMDYERAQRAAERLWSALEIANGR